MTATYADWLQHVFDHPLPREVDDSVKQAHFQKLQEITLKLSNGELSYADAYADMQSPPWYEWYFQTDADYLTLTPQQTVDYITRAFNSIDNVAKSYSDGQMNQGINYIINNACSNYIFSLVDETVALNQRIAAVESFYSVYEKLYAVKCSPTLGHKSEQGNPLNMTCYMWWDVIPFYGKSGEEPYEQLDQTILEVMKYSLNLPNDACQEGALHGLGHWYHAYPEQVAAIIDTYLENNPNLRPELLEYAQQAGTGCLL